MFTVILLSDRSKVHFNRWSALFEPFVDEGSIAFCEWHHAGSVHTLAQAVPTLNETIRGRTEWQAIIVDTGGSRLGHEQETQPDNPFDYLDNCVADPETGRVFEGLSLVESPHPIVRLCHMLLGYPELGTKAFEPDPSFWDTELDQRIYKSEFMAQRRAQGFDDESSEALFRAKTLTENDIQVHYREIAYTDDERHRHHMLSRRYRVQHTPPTDVILFATRDPVSADPTAAIRRAWGEDIEHGTSRFVQRNDYPPSCRFGVYDLHPHDHNDFEIDELRFWLSVLTLATSDVPPSSFQADRLYRVDIGLDGVRLADVLNDHLGQLMATRDTIDAHIRSAPPAQELDLNEVLRQREVRVLFDKLGGEDLVVSTKGYALANDVPRSESGRWAQSSAELAQRAENFIRKPRRVLSRSVFEARQQMHSTLDESFALTEIERDELREVLTERTKRLTQPTTSRILDSGRLRSMFDDYDTRIRRTIQGRMRMGTIVASSLVVFLVWLAAFTPYLIQAAFIGWSNFGYSLLVALITLGVIALIGLSVLLFMRWRLIALLRTLNRDLRTFVRDVNAGASEFAKYLSDLVTYMVGRRIFNEVSRGDSSEQSTRLRLAGMRKRIAERIESEKAIIRGLGQPVRVERVEEDSVFQGGINFHALKKIFRLPRGRRQAALNESGEYVEAPYDFVKHLTIEHLTIPERIIVPQNRQETVVGEVQ